MRGALPVAILLAAMALSACAHRREIGGFDPGNETFVIDGRSIQLHKGRQATGIPCSDAVEETAIVAAPVAADLDGDGRAEMLVWLNHQSGGSGSFYYVAAAGSGRPARAVPVGDRIAPGEIVAKGGEVVIHWRDRPDDAPMSDAPTVDRARRLLWRDGALVVAALLDPVRLKTPAAGARVGSPLRLAGEISGSWLFEGDFPAQLRDADGRVLATAPMRALGNWMTPDHVPFEGELSWTAPATGPATGVLRLMKNNPSDDRSKDAFVDIPVRLR